MSVQSTDRDTDFGGIIQTPLVRTKRNNPELRVAVARLTSAETLVYANLRSHSFTDADPTFLNAGYIVVNASDHPSKRHGRSKFHMANLVRKGLIVSLSPSRARSQLYLVGCVFEGQSYYVLWLDEIFAWGKQVIPPGYEASREASLRAMRPTRRETPQTLMDKGFVPLWPRTAQSSLHLISK